MGAVDEDLLLDKLVSGDKPSVYAAGIVAAKSLKETGTAVFMTDVLGRVHLLPPTSVHIIVKPKLSDEELSTFSEEEAARLLLQQGDSEDEIIRYLHRRSSAQGEL